MDKKDAALIPTRKTIQLEDVFSFLQSPCRGWHDRWSKTYVVDVAKLKERKELNYELDLIGVPE